LGVATFRTKALPHSKRARTALRGAKASEGYYRKEAQSAVADRIGHRTGAMRTSGNSSSETVRKGVRATLRAWIWLLYGAGKGPLGALWGYAGVPSDPFRTVSLGTRVHRDKSVLAR